MECKECKIVCDGKEIAQLKCEKDEIKIKCTDDCKKFFKGCC